MTNQVEIFRIDLIGKGCLAIMAHPASAGDAAAAVAKIAELNFHQVVSLLEPAEADALGLAGEAELVAAQSMNYVSFAIPDMGQPVCSEDFTQLAQRLFSEIETGTNTLIHCRGGIGRSGLLAAAVLLIGGRSIQAAFAQVSRIRGMPVPETPQQAAWLQTNLAVVTRAMDRVSQSASA